MGTTSIMEDLEALQAAMQRILIELGRHGWSISFDTKAQARIAYEPFADERDRELMVTLDDARRVLRDLGE